MGQGVLGGALFTLPLMFENEVMVLAGGDGLESISDILAQYVCTSCIGERERRWREGKEIEIERWRER